MDISALDKAFSENINSVKYTDSKKSWKVSDRITIDWRNVLPDPPANNSKETAKELEYLQAITKKLTISERNLIELVDKEPLDLYNPILRRHDLKMPKKDFKKIYNLTYPVLMNL